MASGSAAAQPWHGYPGGRTRWLLRAFAGGDVPQPYALLRYADLPDVPPGERAITADQTNESVVVGERLVVKWMRPSGGVPHRAPGLFGHLVATGFTRMPTPYGALLCGAELVALVCAYLPGAEDGWDWAAAALTAELTGGPPADFAADLGVLVGELHVALATASRVYTEPVSHVAADWVKPASRIVDEAIALIVAADVESVNTHDASVNIPPARSRPTDGDWLTAVSARMHREIAAAAAVVRTPVLRTHADLHVGQVLRWAGGYAVTDFDGNPAVSDSPVLEPAARDVAQMRTSLAHIGQIVDRRTGGVHSARIAEWAARGAKVFLEAYRNALSTRSLQWLFDDRLLRPFEVEQECRELIYSARFLIRWRYAPMGVLRSWYEETRDDETS